MAWHGRKSKRKSGLKKRPSPGTRATEDTPRIFWGVRRCGIFRKIFPSGLCPGYFLKYFTDVFAVYDTCDSFPVFLQDEEAEKEDATRTSHLTGGVWHPAVLLLQQKCDGDESPNEVPPTPLGSRSPNAHTTVTPPAMATPRAPSDVLLFAGRQGEKAKNR